MPRFFCTPLLHLLLYVIVIVLPQTLVAGGGAAADVFAEKKKWSIGNDSPVSTGMRGNATARALVEPTFRLLDVLYAEFRHRRKSEHARRCNVPEDHPWVKFAIWTMRAYDMGTLSNLCYSFINVNRAVREGARSLDTTLLRNAARTIVQGRDALFAQIVRLPAPDANWTLGAPFLNGAKPNIRKVQLCLLDTAFAYRVRGRWFLRAEMTNVDPSAMVPAGARHVVFEWVPENYSRSLTVFAAPYGGTSGGRENSTTVLHTGRGRLSAGSAPTGIDDPFGPLKMAFQPSEVRSEQALDSLTLSNTAISALPMVLSLVPVAFIADVNTLGMMAYILLTDIVSTLPFMLKGLELLLMARRTGDVVTALFAGDDNLGQLEISVSTCRGRWWFRTTGIIFVAAAGSIMLGGIALEFFASAVVRRRRERAKLLGGKESDWYGPFGPVLMTRQVNSGVCSRLSDATRVGEFPRQDAEYWNDVYNMVYGIRRISVRTSPSGRNSTAAKSSP